MFWRFQLVIRLQFKLTSRFNLQPANLILCLVIGWFFRSYFRLQQSSFHLLIRDGVVHDGIGTKWKLSSHSDFVELMTPLTTLIFDFH